MLYDCLYPHTIGGAERWYRKLSERLAAEGHTVTYLTLRQWPKNEDPGVSNVRVVAVGPQMGLYGAGGQRRILPPLIFGIGVFWHLARYGRRYDVVHTASFPYFSLLAAATLRRFHKFSIVVDWFELWTREYWREYLGRVGGRIGWGIQALCSRVKQQAFCFARVTERRLLDLGVNGRVERLEGAYVGSRESKDPKPAKPLVVFAGRHIPEKRVPLVVSAIAAARKQIPELRGVIFGDGPERQAVLTAISNYQLREVIECPGFVEEARLAASLEEALCMVLPSKREGYGMIVIESAAVGVPSIVVDDPDNAAVELVEQGVNGFVSPHASGNAIATKIVEAFAADGQLRNSTRQWFIDNVDRLSLERSLSIVARRYSSD